MASWLSSKHMLSCFWGHQEGNQLLVNSLMNINILGPGLKLETHHPRHPTVNVLSKRFEGYDFCYYLW